jgi:hypothetical protein
MDHDKVKILNKFLGGAEIISIDAFNKAPPSNDFVIGITIIKVADSRVVR